MSAWGRTATGPPSDPCTPGAKWESLRRRTRLPASVKFLAPLTSLERTLLEIVQRRDRSRRWHVVHRRRQAARKTGGSERSAKGSDRPEAE